MEANHTAQENNHASSIAWARQFNAVKGKPLTTWVSSFHHGVSCSIIDHISGTFNLNCHIRFADGLDWIVRFPVAGRAMGDLDAKVRHEVAAMKLLKSRTSIPIPDIVAWGTSDVCPLKLGPFIVMTYMKGNVLGRLLEVPGHLPGGKILKDDIDPAILDYLYKQIARFIIEISQIEFPLIGAISEVEGGFCVESGPVTVKMNDIERQDGICLQASSRPLQTTTQFFDHLLGLEMDHLRLYPGSARDADDARKKFQRLSKLRKVLPRFVEPAWDTGPFVLRCEGMRYGNMLVDENFTITAVLDWEWSYTAPKQMLYSPPRWLIIRRPMHWNTKAPWEATCSARYLECFHRFIEILKQEEDIMERERPIDAAKSDRESLSLLMNKSLKSGILWFHELLLTPSAYRHESIWGKIEQLLSGNGRIEDSDGKEIVEFMKFKRKQLYETEEPRNRDVEKNGGHKEGILNIGIMEILDSC